MGSGGPATSRRRSPWVPCVSNDEGRILLIQRSDSGSRLYPTGWADVGYSAPRWR